jgi:hypothetical protein
VNDERVTSYSFGRDQVIYTQKWARLGFTSPETIVSGSTYEITIVSENGVPSVYVWES